MISNYVNNHIEYAIIGPIYWPILGQWLREVYVSIAQRPRTQTQSVYIVLGNFMLF